MEIPSHGATYLDPSLKWKTLETPHFSINYYTGLEDVAKKLAPIAEDVYSTMTKVFKYKIGMKTQVTIMDVTDDGNGYTTVFPYPSVTLYLADLSSSPNAYKYDNYLRYLFLHEYTHALHLDMAEGSVSIMRAIFGRSFFPNAIEPWFMIEGLATYMETKYTNAGRGRDPRWNMMMRMDVLEDNLKSIDQAAVDTIQWPMGNLRYLYGVQFLQYLSDKYGEDKLVTLTHIYGDYLFSVGFDGAFVALYGKNISMLWNDWLEDTKSKVESQKSKLGALIEPKTITESGYQNLKPKWSADSKTIYYIQNNADDYPQIRRLDPATGRSENIFEGLLHDDSLSLSGDGRRLYFSKTDVYKNFYYYRDIFFFDLVSKKLSRLSEGLRAHDAAISPVANDLVYVTDVKGERKLVVSDEQKPATESRLEVGTSYRGFQGNYFSPVFSPDGKSIAVAKRLASGEQRIVLIDPTSQKEKELTSGLRTSSEAVSEANPTFSADGKYILFDADYTGIVNLYACELASGKVYRITNTIGGIMMPDVSPDGKKIACVSYSSRGYDIAEMEFKPSDWHEMANSVTVTMPVSSIVDRPSSVESYKIHDYNPLPTLMPTFWMPYSYYNESGPQNSIYLGGVDPLQQQVYYLNLGYDFTVPRPSYTLYYANNQFLPQIAFSLSDLAIQYGWGGPTYWERERDNLMTVTLFQNRLFSEYDHQAVLVGLHSINLTNISSLDGLNPTPSRGNINSVLLAWRYLNTRQYAASISPEDGIDLAVGVEKATNDLASDFSFTNFNFSFKNYLRSILKRQVAALTLNGFYSRGDQLAQSNFSWKYIYVRGYPSTFLAGNKGLKYSAEYRFPLAYLERGLLYGATFFDRLWGDVIFDVGGATFGRVDELQYKKGIGTELNLEVSSLWGYYAIALKLGYAKGLDAGGEEGWYFTFAL